MEEAIVVPPRFVTTAVTIMIRRSHTNDVTTTVGENARREKDHPLFILSSLTTK